MSEHLLSYKSLIFSIVFSKGIPSAPREIKMCQELCKSFCYHLQTHKNFMNTILVQNNYLAF